MEVDHIDPALKVSHRVWSWSPPRRAAELAKCRVLCGVCHLAKSAVENSRAKMGAGNPHAKLGEAEVIAIRASSRPCRDLADEYDVHPVTISKIRRRATWKHVA
jgi:hypothetical protein